MTALVLFLLFTVVPTIETWLLIRIGSVVGATETVAYLVAMGLLGAWLGKRAGFTVMRQLFDGLRAGEPPADKLVEAGLVLVGSVLLVTPGVLTDATGIVLFLGPVRRFLAPRVKRALLAWLERRGMKVGTLGPGPAAQERERRERRVFTHPPA
ncbi:MAG: FxsA family protein [Myxococcota bacterium]